MTAAEATRARADARHFNNLFDLMVYPDTARLAAHDLSLLEVLEALQKANVNVYAGAYGQANRSMRLEADPRFGDAEEVAGTPVSEHGGALVYLRDVARIEDGPGEVKTYTRIGFGPAFAESVQLSPHSMSFAPLSSRADDRGNTPHSPEESEFRERDCQAVTLAIAKRKGANAVTVAEQLIETTRGLYGELIPEDVAVTVTRNQGETANHKVNELVKHLFIAIATIIVLLAFALGPKEALIVALAVPMTPMPLS